MSQIPRPSQYILQKAWKLGRKMASTERRLRPELFRAHEYPSYELFRLTHRHQLEHLNAFIPWDQKLQVLIEREGRGGGYRLDDPRIWEIFYAHVASQIASAFWFGWEQVYQLEQLYENRCQEARAKYAARVPVLHIAQAAATPKDDSEDHPDDAEQGLWNQVATKLFEEKKIDDASGFWALPAAESAGRKSA